MSKVPCDVIKDLLPLYEDNVCSEKSKDMVEEHLTECESCRAYYERMTEKLPAVEDETIVGMNAEDSFLTHINRKLTYQRLLGCGITFLVILLIFIFLERLSTSDLQTNIPFLDKRVEVSDIKVSELYQLKDGSIYFTLISDKDCSNTYTTSIFVPDSKNGEYDNNGWRIVTLENHTVHDLLFNDFRFNQASYACPLMEESNNDDRDPSVKYCNTIFYEGKGNERKIIWQEGQNILPAPESIESKIKGEKQNSDLTPEDPVYILQND